MIAASAGLHAGCALIGLVWGALVLLAGRDRGAVLPAGVCLVAAAWAGAVALTPDTPLDGPAGALEILRAGGWLLLLGALSRRFVGRGAGALVRRFEATGAFLAAVALLLLLPGAAGALVLPTLGSPALLARLVLVLLVVLLAENLWRNASESAAWHVNLPCIALGGLGAFDVILYAHAALTGAFSPALLDARAALSALAMPLLAVAALRDRRWRRDPALSRDVVFHGATLVVAGTFLLGMGATSEALRHLNAGWGRTAQASLVAGALMVLAVAVASRSVRSRVRRLVVDHFFSARYDYRREWLRCVAALSAPDAGPDRGAGAQARAIRAIADAVDSPAGVLFLSAALPQEGGGLRWAGSWNLPAAALSLPPGDPLLAALAADDRVLVLDPGAAPAGGGPDAAAGALRGAYGPLWLAVPLRHRAGGLFGAVALAPPRAPFPLDEEVFGLLRTLGREVAMFLGERRAAEHLADSRRITDYARRFAFVAHDVKTVSSQLTLLLANAEDNIADPEFQADMLLTVRAAAARIDTLIERLRGDEGRADAPSPGPSPAPATTAPFDRLRALARGRAHPVQVEEASPSGGVAMGPEQFDAVATHLIDNAAEASAPHDPVRVLLRREAGRVVVDIADRGAGMTPEFVRDELFRPLRTTKPRGNGIGAWQARELLRQAGGELEVISRPGRGTTMRLLLPAVPSAVAP